MGIIHNNVVLKKGGNLPIIDIKGMNLANLDALPSEMDEALLKVEESLRKAAASNKVLNITPEDISVCFVREHVQRDGDDIIIEIRCDRKPERTKSVLDDVAKSVLASFLAFFPFTKRIFAITLPIEESEGRVQYDRAKK